MRDRDAAALALALFAGWKILSSRRVRVPEDDHEGDAILPPSDAPGWPDTSTRAASATRTSLPYVGRHGAPCVDALTPLAQSLRDRVRAQFPRVHRIGGIRCGDASNNLHAVGRALDIVPTSHDEGDSIANWLVTNAAALQLQLVIWDRTVWQGSLPAARRFDAYTGTNPHTDHVHVETNA